MVLDVDGDLGKGGEEAARAEYTMDRYFRVRVRVRAFFKKNKMLESLVRYRREGHRRESKGRARGFLLVCTVLVYT